MSLVEPLEWDSSFFGFAIGKVRGDIAASEVGLAVQEADARKLRCTYLLVAGGDDQLLARAQEHGFLVRDIRVELERPVAGHPASLAADMRLGRLDDLPELEAIARGQFRGTRFFTDSGFPPDRSAELYVEWLRKGLAGEPGWTALVADNGCGFVVCQLDSSSSVGVIGLLGVASDVTGRGVGSALITGAGSLFTGGSLLTARVVTQGHNVAAQRLYQAHGYRTSKMHLWLHRWLA